MKSCFFIGHREAGEEVFPALVEAVERHITEYGVSEFFVGNYGAFDRMAARAVIMLRERHPGITLSLLLPYHPAERPVDLPAGFDGTFYPPRHGEGPPEGGDLPGEPVYGGPCGLSDRLRVAPGQQRPGAGGPRRQADPSHPAVTSTNAAGSVRVSSFLRLISPSTGG